MTKRLRLTIKPKPEDPAPGPNLFPFHNHMSPHSYQNWINLSRLITGDPDWRPADVLYIESHKEIVNIMQERPKGKQALL